MTNDCDCTLYDSTGALIVREPVEEETKLALIVENGEDGTDGIDGLSAYQLAVQNGFVGTLLEWIDSLKPAKSRYDIAYALQGPILPFERLPDILVVVPFGFPLDFAGSGAYANTPSSVATIFDISKFDNALNTITKIGTLTFPANTNIGVFQGPATQFGFYDRLILAAQENIGSTLADVALTFAAQR